MLRGAEKTEELVRSAAAATKSWASLTVARGRLRLALRLRRTRPERPISSALF